jgi:ribosome-binding factor A
MSLRMEKVNELIRQKTAEIVARDVDFKLGVFVTVTKADVSPDLRHARVLVSVLPLSEGHYVLETLKHEAYSLQRALNKQLHMKPLPRIAFVLDTTEDRAQKVEDILQDI